MSSVAELGPEQLWLIVSVAATVALGSAVQSAVGFGMGLVVVPLLLWCGLSLPSAVLLSLGGGVLQCAYGLYLGREHIQWRHSLGVAVFQSLGIIGGVACMAWIVATEPATLKQIVGLLILALLILQVSLRPQPRERLARPWLVLAGLSSGFLGGLVGIGGPPLVFYTLAHAWERDQTRVFLWSAFVLATPVLIAVLCVRFGVDMLIWVAGGVALLPVLLLGTRVGLTLTARWSAERLRAVAVGLLFIIAAMNIAAPYLP